MPSTTILEEIEAEKTAQQRLRHLSSVSSLPSADLAFIDGFWERHLADMPGRDGYPEGCLLLLDDVRAVLSGSVGALLVIAPQHYNCIEIFDKDHSLIADWTPETAQERHLRQQLSLQALEEWGPPTEFAKYNILNDERIGSFYSTYNPDAHPCVALEGRIPCHPGAHHKTKGVAVTGSGADVWLKVGTPLLTFYKQLEAESSRGG